MSIRLDIIKNMTFKHYVTKICIPTPVMATVNTDKFTWWKNTNMRKNIQRYDQILTFS